MARDWSGRCLSGGGRDRRGRTRGTTRDYVVSSCKQLEQYMQGRKSSGDADLSDEHLLQYVDLVYSLVCTEQGVVNVRRWLVYKRSHRGAWCKQPPLWEPLVSLAGCRVMAVLCAVDCCTTHLAEGGAFAH